VFVSILLSTFGGVSIFFFWKKFIREPGFLADDFVFGVALPSTFLPDPAIFGVLLDIPFGVALPSTFLLDLGVLLDVTFAVEPSTFLSDFGVFLDVAFGVTLPSTFFA